MIETARQQQLSYQLGKVSRQTQTEELHSKLTFQSWLVAIEKRPFPHKYSSHMLYLELRVIEGHPTHCRAYTIDLYLSQIAA